MHQCQFRICPYPQIFNDWPFLEVIIRGFATRVIDRKFSTHQLESLIKHDSPVDIGIVWKPKMNGRAEIAKENIHTWYKTENGCFKPSLNWTNEEGRGFFRLHLQGAWVVEMRRNHAVIEPAPPFALSTPSRSAESLTGKRWIPVLQASSYTLTRPYAEIEIKTSHSGWWSWRRGLTELSRWMLFLPSSFTIGLGTEHSTSEAAGWVRHFGFKDCSVAWNTRYVGLLHTRFYIILSAFQDRT